MCRAVGTGQAGAIETESHRQILQGHLLEDLVKRPLQEGGIDVDNGPDSSLRQPRGEGHGMGLADASIEEAIRKSLAGLFQLIPLAHRGRDHRDLGILLHGVEDRAADGVRVSFGAAAFKSQYRAFGANLLKDRRRVKRYRILAGLGTPCAFLSQYVKKDGAALVLDVPKPAAERRQIVAVDRSNVLETQFPEQHAAREYRLAAVSEVVDA